MIYKIDCVELKTNNYNEQYGKFILYPLDWGQGLTLANSLRRILLSDLEGLAVTAIRIAGINSEFSTIPGVHEDILEIILNVKEIVLKSNNINDINEPILGRLKIQGPAIITAGLIDFSQIKVVNKSHYIATLSDNYLLEMEFKVEKGKNYRIINFLNSKDPSDFLQIDSIFMPIRKVNFSIEQDPINCFNEKERVFLELWTNGSISPSSALLSAGKIFQNLVQPLLDENFQIIRSTLSETKKKVDSKLIEELSLSPRAYNGLKKAKINCIGDLSKRSINDLKQIKNLGQKSVEEVTRALKLGFSITLKEK